MATTTFEKTITLDQEAAERLADILDQPAPPKPDLGKDFREENERKVNEWLSQLKSQSEK